MTGKIAKSGQESDTSGPQLPDEPCVCIVEDDEEVCLLLSRFIESWGFRSEIVTGSSLETQWFSQIQADVYLLDLHLPDINGLDLIPDIARHNHDSKIIIITGHADTEAAIRALRLGAFDFLEKPFGREILHHAVQRALEALGNERILKRLLAELKQNQSELLAHKERLEYINDRLLETNRAFSTLARSIDFEREQMEKGITLKIKSVVLPILDSLSREKELAKFALELDMINITLRDLTAGTSNETKIAMALSPAELRVASLIKSGLPTDEIASRLFISQNTVRTHRKNIRRKLKLANANMSLRSYLLNKSPSKPAE